MGVGIGVEEHRSGSVDAQKDAIAGANRTSARDHDVNMSSRP
jgi:hypothetical protein